VVGEDVVVDAKYKEEDNIQVAYFAITTMCSEGSWLIPTK